MYRESQQSSHWQKLEKIKIVEASWVLKEEGGRVSSPHEYEALSSMGCLLQMVFL